MSVPAHAATTLYDWPGSYVMTVPAGVNTLSVVVKGGNGGKGFSSTGVQPNAGQGAKLSGSIEVTPGATIYVVVGGNGSDGQSGSAGGGGGGYSSVSAAIGASPLVIAGGGGGGSFSADGITSRPGGNGGVAGLSGGGEGGDQYAPADSGGASWSGGLGGGNAGGRGGNSGSNGQAASVDGGAGGGGFGGTGGLAGYGPNDGGADSGGNGSTGGGGGGGYGGGGGGDGGMFGVTGGGGGGSSYLPDVTTDVANTSEAPFISITYTLPKQDQTISFPAVPDLALSAGRVLLGADASSFLTVTYTSGTAGVCTINNDEAVLVAAGTCTVYADQAGSETYNAAPQVSRSFTVLPDAVTPSPDPVADRAQVASACGAAPRKIARRGTTRLLGANCRTDAGQSISVQVSVNRKDKKHARLVRARGGAVSIRTDGARVRLTAVWSAGATTGYLPFSVSRSYRT